MNILNKKSLFCFKKAVTSKQKQLSSKANVIFEILVTLRFLCLNERNISLVAICAVI